MPRKPSFPPPKLYLFGPFRLEDETGPVRLSTRKVESLLAFLVLHPEEHAREKLAALFWGESTDTQARDSLRTALKNLRQQLGDNLLLADRETVQLNPEYSLWVDVRELADTISRVAGGEPLANGYLQSALGLYRGGLLTDFYDEWIVPERERLRQQFVEALLRLAHDARMRGECEQAIDWAKRALALDGANELAHRHLMFCYFELGDKVAALKQYDQCARILRAELDVEPSPETFALYREIKQAVLEVPTREARLTNIPNPLTSFVGRTREKEKVKRMIESHRLVTLTGAGGSGKTRLAVQVAIDLVEADAGSSRLYKDGIWWVELAALSDSTLVPGAVAKVLGVREVPNQAFSETLARFVGSKQLLLILDNCEHLIDACARLAVHLLNDCPGLKMLVTSREALGLLGEGVYQVPTLSLPQTLDSPMRQALEDEATLLFIERASSVRSDFSLKDENAPFIIQICRRLDGIPLAIELAAARTRLLKVETIAARLDDRFSLLTSGERTALPRQQTLRATIDWSYDLLPEMGRLLFRRLAVFAGGFTLEAAEQVCSDEKLARRALLDLLTRLVDRSLVFVDHSREGERYRLLETIREYAQEKLGEAGEEEKIRNSHLAFFLNLVEQVEPELERAAQGVWLDRLEMEIDNLRGAIEWALKSGQIVAALRLAGGLRRLWVIRDHHKEAAERLKGMLGRHVANTPTPARLKALNTYFFILWPSRQLLEAQALIEEAMELGEKLGDHLNGAFALLWAGVSAMEQGDFPRAQRHLGQSREIGESLETPLLNTHP